MVRKTGILAAGIIIVLLLAPVSVLPISNTDCMDCHSDPDLVKEETSGEEISLFVNYDVYSQSLHGKFACIDCHKDIAELPHAENLTEVKCYTCHEPEAEVYEFHGRERVGKCEDLPCCKDCHGTHDVFHSSEKKSHVNPINLPKTCGKCHENIDLVKKYHIPLEHPVEIFRNSVHGQAAIGGVYLAATCNDCHSTDGTAHKILSIDNPASSINHFNVPKTCGKCHQSVENDYWEGIHGQLTERGETDSPVCTDCHGEHGILSPDDPRSPVSPTRVAEATCSPCHESARLNEKYGIPTGRFRTWVDSYHGLKSKAGDVTVANCASCHGAHRILPHTDPTSSIYPDNLQSTCGNCHPGISVTLAKTPIHGTPGMSSTPLSSIISNIYIAAIIIIIGLMAIHWLIDLRKQIRMHFKKKSIRRMTYNELWQHMFITITFVVLVITGFSLRFSESDWVKFLFGWEGGFDLRGTIHRVAGVLFILTLVWHTVYLGSKRGREFFVNIFPRRKDFSQFIKMVLFNIGLDKKQPRFGRFSYIEKAEYWALVWGSVVMVISGFFLWFDNIAVRWFPKGFLDVMLVIHYYEAWLATLAIAIWHMYSVVFRPSVYPMNPSWITGGMPEEMYKDEHPLDPVLGESDSANPKSDNKSKS